MDKKEIYEHLAKIYLDASSKKKKRTKTHLKLYKNLSIISLIFLVGASSALFSFFAKQNNVPSETALFLINDPAKINFNFNPAKKESLTINLNQLNLSHFKTLAFSVKNTNPKDLISMRIEFTNTFKEKSEVYLKNIPSKWQEFKIANADFKNITDWSEMLNLSFSVEEWNTQKDKGIVYIDNVRFLK
jgi:hypothetical protein